ncbi:zinc finger-containing protein [Aulographum hederae CBS 113979]|uniref:Zinc finger-containing protein n=1 Tax=Aulographum hederae CBS 113979 TaxID=1176131 RepID=A0A6G1H3I2_9PEZI|nr:zinc finger-containing protein [Aulographum hederae CBS 113979]
MPAIRGADSKKKTRRHTRDLDEIHADLHNERHLAQYKDTKAVEDLPGLGQWYCIECAKWYESETNYTAHLKGKPHKRRVKQLQEEPHTQKEADAAIGLTTDNGKRQKDADMSTRLTTPLQKMEVDSATAQE